jgi:excisionase family DNA binding protein
MLSPRDVAESIGVARETVYRALETGDLRGHKIGTGPKAPWRIRVEDVEAWCS